MYSCTERVRIHVTFKFGPENTGLDPSVVAVAAAGLKKDARHSGSFEEIYYCYIFLKASRKNSLGNIHILRRMFFHFF